MGARPVLSKWVWRLVVLLVAVGQPDSRLALADPGGARLPGWGRPDATRTTSAVPPAATASPSRARLTALTVRTAPGALIVQLELRGPQAPLLRPLVAAAPGSGRIGLELGDVELADGLLAGRLKTDVPISVGLIAPSRLAVMVATPRPMQIVAAEMVTLAPHRIGPLFLAKSAGAGHIAGKTARVFMTLTLSPSADAAGRSQGQAGGKLAAGSAGERSEAGSGQRRKVIVVDAGHGGADPGAIGASGLLEKSIALAVARQMQAQLAAAQRYTVVMTRESDVYVPLGRRVEVSQAADADVFVSIHADSFRTVVTATSAGPATGVATPVVRGASVYALSDRASSEEARRLAETENAADAVAGLPLEGHEAANEVRGILIDLTRRETEMRSSTLQGLVTGELRRVIAVSRDPIRSAAFRVLRQTRTPSVLIELGYMSSAQDEALMVTPEWQHKVATAIVAALDAFLASGDGEARPR